MFYLYSKAELRLELTGKDTAAIRYNPPRGSETAYYFVKEEIRKFGYSNSFYYR
jgi:hypothetical protein